MSLSSSSSTAATLAYAAPAFLAPANLKASRRQQGGGWVSPSSSLSARCPRWALSMSTEGGADTEAETSTAEVPEATKRLLEQAAKIRAEVIWHDRASSAYGGSNGLSQSSLFVVQQQ